MISSLLPAWFGVHVQNREQLKHFLRLLILIWLDDDPSKFNNKKEGNVSPSPLAFYNSNIFTASAEIHKADEEYERIIRSLVGEYWCIKNRKRILRLNNNHPHHIRF